MIPRGTIIAAFLVIELAILGEGVVAVKGRPALTVERPSQALRVPGPQLIEGGPHRIFQAGAHPALTVDIGYADLTIIASPSAQIDVSASPSAAFGMFRETAPITARDDGGVVRIATTDGSGIAIGDDRMVTVVVPPETRVTVVNAGDIEADGLRAEASFNSIGRGSISVSDYAAPALHASSRGRILLRQIATARLDVTSSEGRIEGTALRIRDGSVESSGHVNLGFAAGTDTMVRAEASDGSLHVLGLPDSLLAGRHIRVDNADDSTSQLVRFGSGNGRLDVHSSNGNITLVQDS